jgi:hypothetical protein
MLSYCKVLYLVFALSNTVDESEDNSVVQRVFLVVSISKGQNIVFFSCQALFDQATKIVEYIAYIFMHYVG